MSGNAATSRRTGATLRTLTICPLPRLSTGMERVAQVRRGALPRGYFVVRLLVVVLLELLLALLVTRHDLLHIRARLAERRHALVAADVALAGVVGGDGLLQIAVEAMGKVTEVLRAGVNVLVWVVQVARPQPAAGARHELHQPARADLRARVRLEPRLRLHHRGDERGIDVVLLRLVVDDVAEGDGVGEELTPDDAVDPLHLLVEDAARLLRRRGLSFLLRQPRLVEQGQLVRDEALRQRTGELEQRVRGEAV